MNSREQKGLELAEKVNIRPVGKDVGKWIVPSQTGNSRYLVDLNSDENRCNCPDYELRRCKCKHIFAVEYSIRKSTVTETNDCGDTVVTEVVKVTKRTTYPQNWSAYNAAQTQEKATFQMLLFDLCQSVHEPDQTFGRPRLLLRDTIFAVAFKVYSTVSARRFMCDLAGAHEKGYLEKKPCHSAIFKYMEMSELKPLLEQLIERSSLPLQALETDFAVDASGFSTCRTVTWYNARYGHEQDNHDWIKLHLICGVKTNVVTSVMTSGRHAHDSVPFPALVARTVQNGFDVKQVSADKAYSSRHNLQVVKDIGGEAFIPFKSNATGKAGNCELWAKMYHYYNFNRDTFLEHYHKRSNVESTFSMIKAKFGDSIRSKTEDSIINEALCKILCHNICCVIQSMHEFGIPSTLWTESNVVHKVG